MTQPSIFGLSQEEIRRFPGGFEDVVRTVSTLPGVAINTSGGRNDLLVRGGGPSENLFIINNIEVPNINHFGSQGSSSGSLSFIDLDFVENVSFSTGGFPARYGDKMSSTLSLEMSHGRTDKLGSKIFVSASQYGFNVQGPVLDKGDFIFSARRSYLDLIFKAAGLPFVPVYTDFNFLLYYDLSPKDNLFILGLAAFDGVDRDQSTAENQVFNAGILSNNQNQYISGINYRRRLDSGYLDATINYNVYRFNFAQIDEQQSEYYNSAATESELGFKTMRFWALSDRIGLYGGFSTKINSTLNTTVFADTIYDRSGNKITPASLGLEQYLKLDRYSYKHAFFSELDLLINPHFSLNLGFRGDYYTFLNHPFYLSPRAFLKYKLTEKTTIKTSYGIYYQSPAYVWTLNPENSDLLALKNNMAVIGLDYLLRDDLRISLETYYKDYSDLPTGTIPGLNDYLVITNSGTGFGGREDDFQSFGYSTLISRATGYAYGFEWLIQKKYSALPYYGQLSLSYTKSVFRAGDGRSYPGQYDQRFIFNLAGGYKFNEKWEISSKYRFFSGVPFTPVYRPDENPLNPGYIQNLPAEYLTRRLDNQGVLDLRLDRYFDFSGWRLILFLDIQNILNDKVQSRPQYDFWTNKIVDRNDIGILPSIGISAEF
jgi:outer membrane receptor for ferrienterochelin and colicin